MDLISDKFQAVFHICVNYGWKLEQTLKAEHLHYQDSIHNYE